MKSQFKKFISLFLVAIIGFAAIGNSFFIEEFSETVQTDTHKIFHSDSIPDFNQGLEFSSAKIIVPGFKVLDTVFDFVCNVSVFLLESIQIGNLKASWLEMTHGFFCVYTLLYPFHYFW